MTELLDVLGALQAKGGLLIGFAWMIVEVRRMRRDFNRHEHDEEGKPVIKVLASDQ